MADLKTFYLDRRGSQQRIDVDGSIPTIFVLVGQSRVTRGSSELSSWWKHNGDPLWRIGRNWPRNDVRARSFAQRELDAALTTGYDISVDILSLGQAVWNELPHQHKQVVAEVNAKEGGFESEYRLPGGENSVLRVSDKLPENYRLPFIGAGTLVFQEDPVRLAGLEFPLTS